ncbi:hypothetical protein [Chimaeribacter coloradensis]|uniref:hypothetical protein n=1 Tax=Chimaeribacter coloradensis TaxID=2060068 RepID=UPI0011AF4E10|nr:hypothetical protein [Chimaeribacter coloradensis]
MADRAINTQRNPLSGGLAIILPMSAQHKKRVGPALVGIYRAAFPAAGAHSIIFPRQRGDYL